MTCECGLILVHIKWNNWELRWEKIKRVTFLGLMTTCSSAQSLHGEADFTATPIMESAFSLVRHLVDSTLISRELNGVVITNNAFNKLSQFLFIQRCTLSPPQPKLSMKIWTIAIWRCWQMFVSPEFRWVSLELLDYFNLFDVTQTCGLVNTGFPNKNDTFPGFLLVEISDMLTISQFSFVPFAGTSIAVLPLQPLTFWTSHWPKRQTSSQNIWMLNEITSQTSIHLFSQSNLTVS